MVIAYRNPRLTVSTPDDWVFEFKLKNRRTRKVFDRVIGVNGWVPEERALVIAIVTVNPPRAMREGRTPIILGCQRYRYHQWIQKGRRDLRDTGMLMDTMKI